MYIMNKNIFITSLLTLMASTAMAADATFENYCGGTTDATDYNGDIVNTLTGGTYNQFYGGNVYGFVGEPMPLLGIVAGDVNGNIVNNLDGVTIESHYIGANWNQDVNRNNMPENGVNVGGVTGSVTNIISNSEIKGKFYAGNLSSGPYKDYETGTIGSINTIIKNSQLKYICFTGGGSISKILGDVNVKIEDSTFTDLYQNGGIYVGGNINISLHNVTATGPMDLGTTFISKAPGSQGVKGDINLVLSGTSTVNSSITTGYWDGNTGLQDKDVNITLKDTAKVTGTIYGGSKSSDNSGAKGIKTLNVDSSYIGTDALNINGFDIVNIDDGAKATFASYDTAKNGTILNVKGFVTTSDKNITISEGGSLNLSIKADNQIDASVAKCRRGLLLECRFARR